MSAQEIMHREMRKGPQSRITEGLPLTNLAGRRGLVVLCQRRALQLPAH